MSTLPDFTGPGYFAGESPEGLTTVAGIPVPAQVQVLWRDPADPTGAETLVAQTTSAANGTWQITNLNPGLQYVVRGIKTGFNDVTVVGAMPTRTDIVTATGSFATNEDKNGVDGMVLIESGLPPYTVTQISPLPFGLEPVLDGRVLTIEGTSEDGGTWSSAVRITASNGPHVDISVNVEIDILKDPHWNHVASLLHFDGNLNDEAGGVWGTVPSVGWGFHPSGVLGYKLYKNKGVSTYIDSGKKIDFSAEEDFTIEFFWGGVSNIGASSSYDWLVGTARLGSENRGWKIAYYYHDTRKRFEFWFSGAYILSYEISPPDFKHFAVVRKNGIVKMFLDGTLLPIIGQNNINGVSTNSQYNLSLGDIGGHLNAREAFEIDELRITKGVARYIEDFTPPTKPFPNQ